MGLARGPLAVMTGEAKQVHHIMRNRSRLQWFDAMAFTARSRVPVRIDSGPLSEFYIFRHGQRKTCGESYHEPS